MFRIPALALSFLVAGVVACSSRSKLNHFVLPDGYTGLIALVSDPRFASETYKEDGRYVHTVPPSGVVCVESDNMLRPLFRESAAYSDGTQVFSTSAGLPAPPNSDSIRIQALGSWGSSTEEGYLHWFGVGTEADISALKSLALGDSDEVHLGLRGNTRIPRESHGDFFHLRRYCGRT